MCAISRHFMVYGSFGLTWLCS